MRLQILAMILGIFVAACSLSASVNVGTPVSTEPVGSTSSASAPVAPEIGAATPSIVSTFATIWAPRADWPLYSVTAGDTLGVLAERTGSTTADLAAANCLNDPDSIAVGQQLHIPTIPSVNVGRTQPFQSSYGFAFDYPAGWYLQNVPGGPVSGVILASFPYQLGGAETPEAAWTQEMVMVGFNYAPPALAPELLDDWVEQEKQELLNGGLEIFSEAAITLPSGLPAARMRLFSGSGHVFDNVYMIIAEQHHGERAWEPHPV